MTPDDFVAKWRASELKESSAAQEHFIDLCRLLGEPTPAEGDPTGERYCFERGARKDTGGDGWADVWKRNHFAWEYKGKRADLDAAFDQLRQYALALENPPLLIVSDMARFRIRTNWTNSVSETHEFTLDDLFDAATRDKLKWAMSDPERLQPGESRQTLTERAAATFATLAQSLREHGHEPQAVAHFINRLVFCMFAEDVGLLPNNMFTRMLEHAHQQPDQFATHACRLFGAMSTGGLVGFETVAWFNGGLFDDDAALPLNKAEIETTLKASALDWSEIDPSILGTLFERGLDPDKRSQLGAHYTDRDKIMQIIEPVVIRPWLAEWEEAKALIEASLEKSNASPGQLFTQTRRRRRPESDRLLHDFLKRLRAFTVLDPACGSGNFLYLALQALKDLEHRVQLEAEALGLERGFPETGPANVKGIEINPYAAELARVSVWIGEIQWMRRNGFTGSRDPILKPLDTIECRDALLSQEGEEPEWPAADVVVGNPPFLGWYRFQNVLGDSYTQNLRVTYKEQVPGGADLVCFWFSKASKSVAEGKISRVGLVATNSIRGGANRVVLDRIVGHATIFDAWSDEPWVLNGASVRVSLVCFESVRTTQPCLLNGKEITRISSDLSPGNLDLTKAVPLRHNQSIAFAGIFKDGPFNISGDLARQWLQLPSNPNGRPNSVVLRPWFNGIDVTRRSTGQWVIYFAQMSETEAALYEVPFEYVRTHIFPIRRNNKNRSRRVYWWRHGRPTLDMHKEVRRLSRYIATVRHTKHRCFVWCDARICPDSALIAVARDDDTTFGILHSRFHEAWSLRLGTSLEDRPRYTPTTTFETFPFPEGLSPNIPASEYADDQRAIAIAEAARRLVELRDRWLNPPEWVEWVDEPVPGYPKRPVPVDEAAAKELKKRTLTNLYNTRPQWLADAHAALDAAVAAAYGWGADISEEQALEELLGMNQKAQAQD